MNRRSFVRRSVAGAAGVAVTSVSVRARAESRDIISPPPVAAFELDERTIADLQTAMSSGKYTAHSIAKKYLDRIDDIDKHGPMVNSVIELNPDALTIASEMDRERKAGRVRGPLHGIPVLIKDNIDTHDRMMTTAGSLALEGSIAPKDATVKSERMGEFPFESFVERREWPWRSDEKPLCARSQSMRLEFWHGRRHLGELGYDWRRH
jgi:amidase